LLAWLRTALYAVDTTETALVTRFGRPLEGVKASGFHVKLPWPIDHVTRLDGRILVFDNEPTEMLTQDKKNVLVDSFLCWRIANPLRFAQTVQNRTEAEARLLDLSAELGARLGNEPIESFSILRAAKSIRRRFEGVSDEHRDERELASRSSTSGSTDSICRIRTAPASSSGCGRARGRRRSTARGEGSRSRSKRRPPSRDISWPRARAEAESIRGTGQAEAPMLGGPTPPIPSSTVSYARSTATRS
jgi:membrane protease subunit HflC